MLTEKDYCGQNIEDLLAEVGFPIRDYQFCLQGPGVLIKENVSLYEAQKWLREEHNLHIEVRWYSNLWYEYEVKEAEGKVVAEGSAFPTYEEALSTAVRMAVEHLKEKQDERL